MFSDLFSFMNPIMVFINPKTKLLRSGWRSVVFFLLSPQLLLYLSRQMSEERPSTVLAINPFLILSYAVLIGWTLMVSWWCLRLFDHLDLASLGFSFHRGRVREVLLGGAIGAIMMGAVVGLQIISGGTRLTPNPRWWQAGAINLAGLWDVTSEALAGLTLFALAGAYEELVYRGYPFQTLLRDVRPIIPVLLFAAFFGIAHWDSPNRTFFSTANTMLAGIWLAAAYLKTRSLWFPTALHFTWNWMMGSFFGLPVSGLAVSHQTVFLSTNEAPTWLTGGSYGCEGGAAATVVITIATILIWYTKNPRESTKQTKSNETNEKD
jgi:CAAX protease family protein